jgi:hypothetical protein
MKFASSASAREAARTPALNIGTARRELSGLTVRLPKRLTGPSALVIVGGLLVVTDLSRYWGAQIGGERVSRIGRCGK